MLCVCNQQKCNTCGGLSNIVELNGYSQYLGRQKVSSYLRGGTMTVLQCTSRGGGLCSNASRYFTGRPMNELFVKRQGKSMAARFKIAHGQALHQKLQNTSPTGSRPNASRYPTGRHMTGLLRYLRGRRLTESFTIFHRQTHDRTFHVISQVDL